PVDVVTNDIRLGAERPEEADHTVDRSDGDRLRRRGRERVFRRVIERRTVVALNRFAQTGRAGLKRKASHDVLIISPELEVAVGEARLAQRFGVDSVKRPSLSPVDVVSYDVGRGGLIHIARGRVPGDLNLGLELFRRQLGGGQSQVEERLNHPIVRETGCPSGGIEHPNRVTVTLALPFTLHIQRVVVNDAGTTEWDVVGQYRIDHAGFFRKVLFRQPRRRVERLDQAVNVDALQLRFRRPREWEAQDEMRAPLLDAQGFNMERLARDRR